MLGELLDSHELGGVASRTLDYLASNDKTFLHKRFENGKDLASRQADLVLEFVRCPCIKFKSNATSFQALCEVIYIYDSALVGELVSKSLSQLLS